MTARKLIGYAILAAVAAWLLKHRPESTPAPEGAKVMTDSTAGH